MTGQSPRIAIQCFLHMLLAQNRASLLDVHPIATQRWIGVVLPGIVGAALIERVVLAGEEERGEDGGRGE